MVLSNTGRAVIMSGPEAFGNHPYGNVAQQVPVASTDVGCRQAADYDIVLRRHEPSVRISVSSSTNVEGSGTPAFACVPDLPV